MAPLPPESTARFWLDYSVANVEHSMLVRYNGGATQVPIVATFVFNFLSFVQTQLPTSWLAQGIRYALNASVISLPFDIGSTDLAGFAGTSVPAFNPVNHPRELVYVGRSPTSGRRARLVLYGAELTTPANYRLGPGEGAFAALEVFAAFNAASASNVFVAIDTTPVVWSTYVNVNYNSHWETAARQT